MTTAGAEPIRPAVPKPAWRPRAGTGLGIGEGIAPRPARPGSGGARGTRGLAKSTRAAWEIRRMLSGREFFERRRQAPQ